QKIAKIHHLVKDVDAQCRIFAELTCTAQVVAHPELAAEQIHEVVSVIMAEMRPGYLEVHRDMVDIEIPVPRTLRDWDGVFPRSRSNAGKLEEAVAEATRRLRAARRPLLIGGVELYRERGEQHLIRLAEKLGAPVVTTMLAKGVFPMDHPLHMGIHMGSFGHPAIRKRLRDADLVVALGAQRTDLNLGVAPSPVTPERSIWALEHRVEISSHEYSDISVRDFAAGLADAKLPRRRERVVYYDNLRRPSRRSRHRALATNDMLVEINDFLAACPGYGVVAESGDSLFGGLELRVPAPGLYLAQGYYASMGFAIPAAMGLQIGTGRRPLVLCGDGGFQMTGCDISHAPRLGLSPLVVLADNGGWGIFRPVTPRQEQLDLPQWPYADFAKAWGGAGFVAETAAELHDALREAHQASGFALVQCRLRPDDLSPISRRYIRASARKAKIR
ncbi:MAG: thiamine pyrophosphate-dependent enzyme, partial [Myxococcota bacterium]